MKKLLIFVAWAILVSFTLSFTESVFLLGVGAIILLYYGLKQWKKEYVEFNNFESEWEAVMSEHK